MARTTARPARPSAQEPQGFWDRPALMNLVSDLLIALAVAALAWAATAAVQRLPFFPLRQVVVVTPLGQVTTVQIEQAARVSLVGNFFTVDLDAVRAAFEKLPWVRQAAVRRQWPDTVELALDEHVAAARWKQADAESRLVNTYGEVFAASTSDALPVFAGPEGSAALMLARHREFEAALAAVGRRPQTLVLSPREAWQVKLDDGLVLELGRDEAKHPLAERLARFTAFYPQALAQAHLTAGGVVDMRYPNGFALRPAKQS